MRCVIFWSPPGSEPCGSCDYVYPVEYESKDKLENDFLALALKMHEEWLAYDIIHSVWQEKYNALAEKARKARKPGVVGELDQKLTELYRECPSRPSYEMVFLGESFGYHDIFARSEGRDGKIYENFPEFYTLDDWFERHRIGKES
jgi:hypothetical protein